MTQEEFEKSAMKMFLAGDEPLFLKLREQYLHASVDSREFTGRGFFTNFLIPDEYRIDNLYATIDDVVAYHKDSDELDGFILFIRDGKIDSLEGYSFDGTWVKHYEQRTLAYAYDGKRKYQFKNVE